MAKSKKIKKKKKISKKAAKRKMKNEYPILTARIKRWIFGISLALFALIIVFSFFGKAGTLGEFIFKLLNFFIGKTTFFIPFLLVLGAILVLKPQEKRIFTPIILGLSIIITGISGILNIIGTKENGGRFGYIISWPFLNYLGPSLTAIIFLAFILIGGLIFWEFIPKKETLRPKEKEISPNKIIARDEEKGLSVQEEKKQKPKFEIKTIEVSKKGNKDTANRFQENKPKSGSSSPGLPQNVGEYKFPPIKLLDTKEEIPFSNGDTEQNALIIQRTLKDFGIEVEMSEINIGPTVTQYAFKPADGVKLSKITILNNDLALALAAHPIRIEAPIPGRSLVGIEVPNKKRIKVKAGQLISSPKFQQSPSPLTFCLGKDVMGKQICQDLGAMPHLLIAGATGAGKTICLNSFILNLIYRNSPKDLRLILIDPKRVEFSVYESLPHLLTPVIFSPTKTINALSWLTKEMERRFDVLAKAKTRDISSYKAFLANNSEAEKQGFAPMPYIVLVIDELADLMMAKGREIESGIVRLSQLARAVGIHLVIATQRPSVEVITGLIKANIISRIAFQVASQVDSRTILDMSGAEKLLGWGDMLFVSRDFSKPKRIQGSFISSAEVKKVVAFIEKENKQEGQEEIINGFEETTELSEENFEKDLSGEDSLYKEAKKIVIEYRRASASLLQRRLRIGYARAARLLDMLEEMGVIGPSNGAKPREVYLKGQNRDLGAGEISGTSGKQIIDGNGSEWQKV